MTSMIPPRRRPRHITKRYLAAFDALHQPSRAELAAAVCRLADEGHAEEVIAEKTGLGIELVRQALAARREAGR